MVEHSITDIIASALVALGHVSRPTVARPWPIFLDTEPSAPNNIVTAYSTQGSQQGRTQPDGQVLIYPGLQLRVRCDNYRDGFKQASILAGDLDAMLRINVVLDTKTYLINSVQRTTPVLPIGQEQGGSRQIFTINGLVTFGEVS